ncbi:hypothetical protein ABIB50_001336 [Mucilaginibacter sp. UYCu711]
MVDIQTKTAFYHYKPIKYKLIFINTSTRHYHEAKTI